MPRSGRNVHYNPVSISSSYPKQEGGGLLQMKGMFHHILAINRNLDALIRVRDEEDLLV